MTQYAAAGSLAANIGPHIQQDFPASIVLQEPELPVLLRLANGSRLFTSALDLVTPILLCTTDTRATEISQLLVHQVPEPITIGLLGLGGLFLRRRK